MRVGIVARGIEVGNELVDNVQPLIGKVNYTAVRLLDLGQRWSNQGYAPPRIYFAIIHASSPEKFRLRAHHHPVESKIFTTTPYC